jgi:hypothetical protein
MTMRARKYVVLAFTVVIAAVYQQLAGGWGDLEFYAGGVALIVLICGIGLPWMEYAPDGAFRRNPQP